MDLDKTMWPVFGRILLIRPVIISRIRRTGPDWSMPIGRLEKFQICHNGKEFWRAPSLDRRGNGKDPQNRL